MAQDIRTGVSRRLPAMLLAESGESPVHDRFGRAWITKARKNRMNHKSQARNPNDGDVVAGRMIRFRFWILAIRACFGFRVSNFEFSCLLRFALPPVFLIFCLD
jgi:hypothetical protein